MTRSRHAELVEAMRRLHREKDAAYRDAWKKRGEVISILANLARKVDRLEHVLAGASSGGESIIDTVVDLLVYCLKYETFLGDYDADVALRLFGTKSNLSPPYSDGVGGFEYLLDILQPSDFEATANLAQSATEVVSCFNDLEACFSGIDTTRTAVVRLEHVQQLTSATARLLGVLSQEHRSPFCRFQDSHLEREV